MRAIVIKIGAEKDSKYGGTYRRVTMKSLDDNKIYLLDVYHEHALSRRFEPYLHEQAIFNNLTTMPDRPEFINGKGDFTYEGIKQPKQKQH